MSDAPPSPKGPPNASWSARQLLVWIERHTSSRASSPTVREAERLRARVDELEGLLDAAYAEDAKGVAGDRVAGKPALAQLRSETWERFQRAVRNLPVVRATAGMNGVRREVAARLVPDLYLLGLTAPRGPTEAEDRDRLRRVFDSPAFLAVMSRPEPWADHLRDLVLSQVARSSFRSSVFATFRESSDESTGDRYPSGRS